MVIKYLCSNLRWPGYVPVTLFFELLRSNSTQLNALLQLWTYILMVEDDITVSQH